MIYEELYINDLYLIKPKIYKDNRGFFFESFKNIDFKKIFMMPLLFKRISPIQKKEP